MTVEIVLDPCRVAHFTAGFLSALSVLVSSILVITGFIGFEFYENLQYLKSEDWAVSETLEFMEGFFAAVILMLFLKLFGAI
ncbi:unnamed protein product [marine sediment metagenome]|uniref:Uncharacterized protein n=1 Tax=marine sediment metagenome TaxID=412755 RepID=X1MHL9_9ZZZZ